MVMPIVWSEVLERIFEEVGLHAVLRLVVEYARRQEDKYEDVAPAKYAHWRKVRRSLVQLVEDCFVKEAEVVALRPTESEESQDGQ